MTPPKAPLYRVEFMQGFGMPEVYKREHSKRTYDSAEDAGRMVATIRRWPDHHDLIGVWVTETSWSAVDPESLPVPEYQTEPPEEDA